MRILTCNVNGIRSATNKGFCGWVEKEDPDIICLQEMRILQEQLPAPACLHGYHRYFNLAKRPGYSGVALYTKRKPTKVSYSMGWADMDDEGRFVRADFPNLSIISVYFPSGSHSEDRQKLKMKFLEHFSGLLRKFKRQKREFIICGDINIAHKEIDLKNWRSNQKNSGFLPEERQWLDFVFDELGYIDAFRVINKEPDQYTWWSNRGRAYEKNVGWRIDYHIVSKGLSSRIKHVEVFRNIKFSDHAPLTIDYNWKLG